MSSRVSGPPLLPHHGDSWRGVSAPQAICPGLALVASEGALGDSACPVLPAQTLLAISSTGPWALLPSSTERHPSVSSSHLLLTFASEMLRCPQPWMPLRPLGWHRVVSEGWVLSARSWGEYQSPQAFP